MRMAPTVLLLVPALALAQVNPAARPARDVTALAGTWNGSHLEQRQGCRSSQNDGFHGTYSAYSIYVDTVAHGIVINETGVTGLSCTWSGQYQADNGLTAISGTHTCTDGRSGTFAGQGFFVMPTLMSIRLSLQLSGSETCAIDAILDGARF